MRKTLYLFALAALASSPIANLNAQDSTAAPADAGKLTIGGYLDSYYLTAFNRPQSGNLMGASAGRAFDRLTDQFALGLVQTRFAYSTAKSEAVIDLTFGPNAALGNFGNHLGSYTSGYSPANGNQGGLYASSVAIKQAYFAYKLTDKWSFTVGQFGTHIGYEVIDAPVNYNYSLSNLFNNGPFYHIGAKTQYMFSDKFGVMLGLVNNWDALTDWKSQKTTIAQVFVSPVEGWNLYVNYIGGYHDDAFKLRPYLPGTKEPNSDGNSGTTVARASGTSGGYIRQMIDLTTGYQITDRLYVGINAAIGWYSWQIDKNTQEFNKIGGTATGNSSEASVSYPNPTLGGIIDSDGDGVPDTQEILPGDPVTTEAVISDADGNGKANVAYGNKAWGKSIFGDSSKYQTWGGVAIYANYKLSDMLGIGLRYEHFDDRNGVRYFGGINNSLTVTMPITLAGGSLVIKPEFRWDTGVMGYALGGVDPNAKDADGKQYTTGSGYYFTPDKAANTANGTSNAQTMTSGQSTIGLAFIYKY